MKKLYTLLVLVFCVHYGMLAQCVTPAIAFDGSNQLPTFGPGGVALKYTAASGTKKWQFYNTTTSSWTDVGTSDALTVYKYGQYRMVTVCNGVTAYSNVLDVYWAEMIEDMNIQISTTIELPGVKSEADLTVPSATRYGSSQITYLDAYMRPLQVSNAQISPNRKDLVQFYFYDEKGRASRLYLPFAGEHYTFYSTRPDVSQTSFYNQSGAKLARDSKPYADVSYENSPFERVLEKGKVGSYFNPSSGPLPASDKFTERTNEPNEVLKWTVDNNLNASASSFYPVGTMNVEEVVADAGDKVTTTTVYKDLEGKTILKRYKALLKGSTVPTITNTYNVYDNLGRLVYEIPAKAFTVLASPPYTNYAFGYSANVAMQLMYSYKYDEWNRVKEQRPPGRGAVYTLYDNWHRPILTQDPVQRGLNQWSFVKYDKLGRAIMTGLYTDASTYDQLKAALEAETVQYEIRQAGTSHGYSEGNSFPRTATGKTVDILTVAYFDDYNFDYNNNNVVAGSNYASNDVVMYQNSAELGTSVPQASYYVAGKATGSKTKVLGSNPAKWLWNVSFFDDYGRVIQTRSNSHTAAYPTNPNLQTLLTNFVTVWLDFTGKTLRSVEKQVNGLESPMATYLIKKRFDYDHAGRLLREYQQNNADVEVLVKVLTYNELGQVVEKNLHRPANKTTFLQSVDYTYNIQGQLTHLNNADLNNGLAQNNNDDLNDLFGQRLYYHDLDNGLASALGIANPARNGKTTGVEWKTNNTAYAASDKAKMAYGYTYDALDQLATAQLGRYSTAWTKSKEFKEANAFDLNGNPTQLVRYGKTATGKMDSLAFTYNTESNLLTHVKENATGVGGFVQDPTYGGNAFVYDANGNLIEDRNKGITIGYNHLNLVSSISWKNKTTGMTLGVLEYVYDAAGTMLQKINTPKTGTSTWGTPTVVDYIDGFYYQNNALLFFTQSEGRVLKLANGLRYDYELKDHQGYTRVNFTDANNDGVAEVIQENHFYPSGLRWETCWNNDVMDMFSLQGKEWITDGYGSQSLAWYDFGARMYDPTVMRWWAQDPAYQGYNPYAYCGNNPILYADPDGRLAWFIPILAMMAVNVARAGYNGDINSVGDFFSHAVFGVNASTLMANPVGIVSITAISTLAGMGTGAMAANLITKSMVSNVVLRYTIQGALGGGVGAFFGSLTGGLMYGNSFGQSIMNGLVAMPMGMGFGALFGYVHIKSSLRAQAKAYVKQGKSLEPLKGEGLEPLKVDDPVPATPQPKEPNVQNISNYADELGQPYGGPGSNPADGSNLRASVNPEWAGKGEVKLLNQFNSAESLIQGAGKLTKVKAGMQGFVKGDGPSIFKAVTHSGKLQGNGQYLMQNGMQIGAHVSPKLGEYTIHITPMVSKMIKIRITP